MPRPLLFGVFFTLFGTCWSVGQDVKNDSRPESEVGFEGKKAGDRRELVSGIFFRWCPAGTFTMGSPRAKAEVGYDDGRQGNEDQVSVTLTNGFWLGETELTQGQWQNLMRTTPWKRGTLVKKGDNFAASCISWDDATLFMQNLTSSERRTGALPAGWKYSLPTEAQWEYGCRAGTNTKYSFGEDERNLSKYSWSGGVGGGGNAKTEHYAHQVGLKQPNPWGLKDMHGNLWEWCADGYDIQLKGGQDPIGAVNASKRVDRGGSWASYAVYCRSASRGGVSPDHWNEDLGFRLAVVPE